MRERKLTERRMCPMKLAWLASTAVLAFGALMWAQAPIPASSQDPPQPQTQTPSQPGSIPALPTQDDARIKHDGSKNDVDAVGSRNVGCNRGVGNWYSLEKQVEMGRSLAQQIEAQVKLVNDPVVTEYVNRIGQNLARNSDAQVPFTIKVIDSDVINAITLPGGFIYVNSGLILAADEEAEMAGAMAHEIAHVAACHAARQITKDQLIQFGSIPLVIMGGPVGQLGYEIAGPAGMLSMLRFSREFEAEADYLGIQYMYRAGYDPSALVSFFEKVQAMEKKKSGAMARMFDTHPQTPDRIGKTQKEIRRILPAKQQYVITDSEFDDIKARLAAIENKHKVLDEKDVNKPVLRRTSNPDDKDKDKGKSDDDRPTLKRHDDSNWRWLELGS